ncbi:MAG: malectin domain-containing carbohydrate-binding protein [Bryobacteraceae bacterium]
MVSEERERAELEALLASGIFAKAPSLAQFLTYICDKYFNGESNRIKEYNIAVEALGRPPEFNQVKDSIVRVEAHRIRKRLKQYYENDGATHPIQIVIPVGQYAPEFVARNWEPDSDRGPAMLVSAPDAAHLEISPLGKPRWRRALALAAVVITVLGAFLFRPKSVAERNVAPSIGKPPLTEGEEIRILAGTLEGDYTDSRGALWKHDRYFTGGEPASTRGRAIAGTRDPKIFQTHRAGNFRYAIPLKRGSYELRLYFAETDYGEGNSRGGGEADHQINLQANGHVILSEFDILSDAGGSNRADVRVFKDMGPAADGKLHLDFSRQNGFGATVNALEVLPSLPGRMRPVRIVARDSGYVDSEGREWIADRFFQGGQPVLRTESVTGSSDPGVYRGERFGHFSYVIPVAAGIYTVKLEMAETYFGPDQLGKGGSGSRIFEVLCNGKVLLHNFDLFREAGGSYRGIECSFSGLEPNPQGKLVLSFVPVKNYALINAIEVIDEGTQSVR